MILSHMVRILAQVGVECLDAKGVNTHMQRVRDTQAQRQEYALSHREYLQHSLLMINKTLYGLNIDVFSWLQHQEDILQIILLERSC